MAHSTPTSIDLPVICLSTQTPGAHARYLVLRNCRQDLPTAYITTLALCHKITTAMCTAAVAAAAVMTGQRQRSALRRTGSSLDVLGRVMSS